MHLLFLNGLSLKYFGQELWIGEHITADKFFRKILVERHVADERHPVTNPKRVSTRTILVDSYVADARHCRIWAWEVKTGH